jgi:hypothetical protein
VDNSPEALHHHYTSVADHSYSHLHFGMDSPLHGWVVAMALMPQMAAGSHFGQLAHFGKGSLGSVCATPHQAFGDLLKKM